MTYSTCLKSFLVASVLLKVFGDFFGTIFKWEEMTHERVKMAPSKKC
jgi:hypothetical protein